MPPALSTTVLSRRCVRTKRKPGLEEMSGKKIFQLIVLFTCIFAASVHAQTAWPTRPITMIVPYSAGGGADPVARLPGDGIGKLLGQSIIVEFRPGANATIGTRDVAKAAPDGYTIL